VASERDDVLTLLSSVTSGIFGLLGSPENSTRLLTGTQVGSFADGSIEIISSYNSIHYCVITSSCKQ